MNLKCLVKGHKWGPLEGSGRAVYHTCSYCGRTKKVGEPPADAHDKSDVHQ